MAGMAAYVPTPKSDAFKPGDTVQWRDTSLLGHAYRLGQLWSRAENPEHRVGWEWRSIQGKFWFAVTEDGTAHLVNERKLSHVMARGEHLQLI